MFAHFAWANYYILLLLGNSHDLQIHECGISVPRFFCRQLSFEALGRRIKSCARHEFRD